MALPKHGIETSLREFFKATIAGGLLFLLPVVLILIVLRHAMKLAVKITKPISDLLPVELLRSKTGTREHPLLKTEIALLAFISRGLTRLGVDDSSLPKPVGRPPMLGYPLAGDN